jgi:hypothetical protein
MLVAMRTRRLVSALLPLLGIPFLLSTGCAEEPDVRAAMPAPPPAQAGPPVFPGPPPIAAQPVLAGPTQPLGPPGTLLVRFFSADAERRWEVVADGAVLCTTPCDRWLDPATPLAMRSEAGFLRKDEVTVPDLSPWPPGGPPVTVRAFPRASGLYSLGVTTTTLAALGAAAGIAIMSVGCATQDHTMCEGGVITASASLPLLAPGIYFIVRSRPRARIVAQEGGAAPLRYMKVGPGFVTGAF